MLFFSFKRWSNYQVTEIHTTLFKQLEQWPSGTNTLEQGKAQALCADRNLVKYKYEVSVTATRSLCFKTQLEVTTFREPFNVLSIIRNALVQLCVTFCQVLRQIWSAVVACVRPSHKHIRALCLRTHRSVVRSNLDQDSANVKADERFDDRTIPEFRQGKNCSHWLTHIL